MQQLPKLRILLERVHLEALLVDTDTPAVYV